ncbi:hypothetical protein [Vagococcus sp.]|uniref:hypothetical protein n=1 Tax=Vagococcus sp. TaxID=1933889 RepID=UPI003F9517CC
MNKNIQIIIFLHLLILGYPFAGHYLTFENTHTISNLTLTLSVLLAITTFLFTLNITKNVSVLKKVIILPVSFVFCFLIPLYLLNSLMF